MSDIFIYDVDAVYVRVECEYHIAEQLSAYFTFNVPGARFTPKYKAGQWDGKIRLFNLYNRRIRAGLVDRMLRFAKANGYKATYLSTTPYIENEAMTDEEYSTFVESLCLTDGIEDRDYQEMGFRIAADEQRALLLSPTSSGKSLLAYSISRYYMEHISGKVLIVVPTVQLVNQMYGDFEEYGYDSENNVHIIKSGSDKNTDKPIIVSTWQSIHKMPKEYFHQFEVIIGDEAHGFNAKKLSHIMDNLINAYVRIGMTGTLDGTKTNELALISMFGPKHELIKTHELITRGFASDITIKGIVLQYSDEDRKKVARVPYIDKGKTKYRHMTYQEEIDFIVQHPGRMKVITSLAKNIKGNTLILYRYVEKHGKPLYENISKVKDDVYFVHGKISGDERDRIRKLVEERDNMTIIASIGTFSTGTNMKNLHNAIFAHPQKGRIKVLQSIGRLLRKALGKEYATLFDIADDLSWKKYKNFSLNHFLIRIETYAKQKFEYKVFNRKL